MGATAWTPAAAACLALCPTKPATLRNCDNRDKLIQLLSEDIRSRGSQQNAFGQGRAEEAQAEAVGPAPKLLLHGREMPRMLPNHHGVLSRPDRCCLLGLLHRPLPVHRWKSKAH